MLDGSCVGQKRDAAPATWRAVLVTVDHPGTWILHCHISHHMTNAHSSFGGPLFAWKVKEYANTVGRDESQ